MQALKWLGVELIVVSRKEKLVSALGATLAIYLVFAITQSVLPTSSAISVVASMGATAVLLFAVPHGALSQPWPLLGGHLISAVVGVCCTQAIDYPILAAAVAVGASIGLMQQLKCIHPPGGATAFTAVMGGHGIHELGFYYVLIPVGLNALAMLTLAIAINYPFPWRRYPAAWITRKAVSKQSKAGDNVTASNTLQSSSSARPLRSDVVDISADEHRRFVEAVRSIDSFVDVSEEDLIYLARTMFHLSQRRSATPLEPMAPATIHTTSLVAPEMNRT